MSTSEKDLTAEKIVRALIDRLILMEKRVDAFRAELEELRDMQADNCPWLLPTGQIRFRNVLVVDSEDLTVHEVIIAPVSVSAPTAKDG
jgi:hypothetical protein